MYFFFYEEPLIAIIGDIRKSRLLPERKEVQDKLKMVLDEINLKYEGDISAKFLITLGDEFQGLLSNGKYALKIIQEIRMQLCPTEVRFGIGVGKITTEINTDMALGADGPGYYNARDAIEILKKNEKKNKAVLSDIRLAMEGENAKQTVLVNTIFELMKSMEQTWTGRQKEVIWDMLKNQDNQNNVANRLGISQSSVQKSLAKGHYYVYENAMKNVAGILGEIGA
jgi:hypothetical protein